MLVSAAGAGRAQSPPDTASPAVRPLTVTDPASPPPPATTGKPRFGIALDALRRVPGDLRRIVGYPVNYPGDLIKPASAVGLLIALDKPITQLYQERVEQPLRGFKLPDAPKPFKTVGTGGTDGWLAMGISATYLSGFIANNARAQQAALAAGKSLAYTVVASHMLLKSVFGRRRPLASLKSGTPDGVYTSNPLDFGVRRTPTIFSDAVGSSFPSFHFAAWFAVARTYHQAYDNAWLPYSALTLGLASNIRGHRHWVSDMVAGALVGTAIGSAVTGNKFGLPSNLSVEPSLGAAGPQLRVAYAF